MTPQEVYDYFGSQAATAKALGITKGAMTYWNSTGVPPLRQAQIEVLTKGKLKSCLLEDIEPSAPSTKARTALTANIKKFVDIHGSQAKLSRFTGVPQKTISRALNSENAVTLDTLDELAVGLGIEPWQLLFHGQESVVDTAARLAAILCRTEDQLFAIASGLEGERQRLTGENS